jgi:hypothetical protein
MTVKEIIEKYLVDKGYGGLCDSECGCFLGGLMPCGMADPECVPGYAYDINRGETCKGCADECPFLGMDAPVAKYGRICLLENFPVKCRELQEARDGG